LKPLSAEESLAYIDHRLQVVNCETSPFSTDALVLIHEFSEGVPRLINTICDNALFEAFLRHNTEVTAEVINSVAEDLGLSTFGSTVAPVSEQEDSLDVSLEDIEIVFDGLEEN